MSDSTYIYTMPDVGTNANFVMDQGNQTIAGTKSFTTPIAATSGGTGRNSYTAGDMLYANTTTTLDTLHVGGSNQVLGVSGGSPAWVTNGSTITSATKDTTVAAAGTLAFSATAGYIRIMNSSGGTLNVSGINSTGFSNGSVVTLVNVSANTIQITNLDGTEGSASVNQFDLPGGQPLLLGQRGAATFLYDAEDNTDASHLGKWVLVSTND